MKLIFTGDWQAEFINLDVLETVCKQIRKEKPDCLVLLGDLKETYNPLDIRVLNFMLTQIEKFEERGILVWINPGNHDRVGLTNDKESWLPALEKAGAFVAYEPDQYVCQDRVELNFLPYRSSTDEVRRNATELARSPRNTKWCSILCFHQGLKEAKYNDFTRAGEEPLSVDDLCPKEYDLVVGAHLHLHQKVKYDHVRYVGSPFASDWGECNQVKGYLKVEV